MDPHDAGFVLGPPRSSFVVYFVFLVVFYLLQLPLIFSCFSSPDVLAAAAENCGTQCCKKLLFSAFNARADSTVITNCRSFCKFKAWCSNHTRDSSFLPATPITVSLYLNHLLELSLSGSTIHSALYAINWVHKLAGFEDVNLCDKFLVKSIAEASSRIPRGPVKKAEPITPEIIGLIFKHGGSKNLLEVRFVCMCVLAYAGFFRISELLCIRRSNILTEDS